MKNNAKSMAKLFPAVLASMLMLSLTACGSTAKEPVNVDSEVSTESEIEVENIESEKTEVAIDSTKAPDASKEEIAKEVAEKVEEIKEETKEEVKVDEEKTKVETTTPSKEVGESTNTTPSETIPSTPIETPVYEGTSYYTNTQTPMHLVKENGVLVTGDDKYYYVVDSFNRYALNNIDNEYWIDVHNDDFDTWYEIECGRATFKDGVYTSLPGNGCFLQMNTYLNIDGHGGPAPGLTNPITKHPEGGGCYYFNYNTDYSYVSTEFRIWDREKLALITPDYLGVENLLYDWMFNGTDKFGPNCDQPEYVGNTKIEYLGKQADCEFSYIFRISQR